MNNIHKSLLRTVVIVMVVVLPLAYRAVLSSRRIEARVSESE